MISIEEALKLSLDKTEISTKSETVLLSVALGHRLFKDQFSEIDMPPFPQSAMDGYALNIHPDLEYKIIGEQKAGDGIDFPLKPGEAIRIFTGALVPMQANSIVIQEKVRRENERLFLEESPKLNSNIRPQGEQIKKAEIALRKGEVLNPASIGFLASLGISEVEVFSKPKVGILTTGNELVKAKETLKPGQIYESNQIMLTAALQAKGIFSIIEYQVNDDLKATEDIIQLAISECDYLLISGGISVGDYDFVGRALETNEVNCHFYKVAQKPGKPLWFGSKNNILVFALPGNPAAALTCFYLYVLPSIKKWMGDKDSSIKWETAKLENSYSKKGIRPQFLKAKWELGTIKILEGQNSSMLHTFANANAICFADGSEEYELPIGSEVKFFRI